MLRTIQWLATTLAIGTSALGEEERAVEPVNVEEVLPNEPGAAEARLSLTAIVAPGDEGGRPEVSVVPGVQLFLGLTDRLGIELGGSIGQPFGSRPPVFRLAVAAKLLLVTPEGSFPGVAAKLELAPASGEPAEVSGSLGFIHGAGRLTAQGAVGLWARLDGTEWTAEFNASIALRATDRLFVFVEGAGEWELAAGAPLRASAGPAVKWVVSPSMFLALGAVFGLDPGADPVRVALQLQHAL